MKFYRLFGLSLLVAGASSGVSAYMNANCGSADDWPSHHLCCSQPGASENSIWAAAPGSGWHCTYQQRSNCGVNTHIWDNDGKFVTQDTMPSYCKARGQGDPVYDGRPPAMKLESEPVTAATQQTH
ncbi:hypothetical protein GCM10023116_10940 [Kistimonas scapharcae]|uniref:Uncharacterized protein n=1 Tax=Kistimonas scapharcae TaxID=1036133 RepID=A0ABP8UY55_9GAMM